MQSPLVIKADGAGWSIYPPPDLPVAALMLGKPVEDAAALLPRLFNSCSGAQAMALRLALGLPVPDASTLRAEILRDHVLKLCIVWPVLLRMNPLALPTNLDRPATLRSLIWGSAAGLEFDDWLRSAQGVAPVVAAIAKAFAPNEAIAILPMVTASTALEASAQENSVAARHARAPAMLRIEASHGRGPFWRAAGLIHDMAALLDGVPEVQVQDGTAIVAAARGACAVRAGAVGGRLSHFIRRTPTDHLCAKGGVLQQSLNSLPATKAHLLPLLADILSPCVPVQLPQVSHA
jgi:hypothetical protein